MKKQNLKTKVASVGLRKTIRRGAALALVLAALSVTWILVPEPVAADGGLYTMTVSCNYHPGRGQYVTTRQIDAYPDGGLISAEIIGSCTGPWEMDCLVDTVLATVCPPAIAP